MIAENKRPKTFRVKVKRQDTVEGRSYWQAFDVEYKQNMNVISALQWIAAHPRTVEGKKTTPVVWECNCLEEICGACTMLVNGKVRQACSALIDDLLVSGNVITLEPMTKFPVVRDLHVDRQRIFEDLKRIEGWVPIDGTYDLGAGPEENQENQDVRYELSRCMSCGCCLEACPQYTLYNHFVGAAIVSQARYFNMHGTSEANSDNRMGVLMSPGGIVDCGNSQNCVKVCPKDIPLTESIGDVGRYVTIYSIRKFFAG